MDHTTGREAERFPARSLLIDTTGPWTIDVSESVSTALAHFFALITNTAGSNKINSLNIILFGKDVECVYPLQAVKTNIAKLIRVINQIKLRGCVELNEVLYQDTLSAAVDQTFSQFRRSFVANRQHHGASTTQVEICVLTLHKRKLVEKCFEKILKDIDIAVLKKIQVIHIKPDYELKSPLAKIEDTVSQECDEDMSAECIQEYFEFFEVANDYIELECNFKSWLVDNGVDDVQLTIDVNSSAKNGFKLKCDVNERLLNPTMMSYSQLKLFHSGAQRNQCIHCSSSVKNNQIGANGCNFKVIKLINISGVCESVVYGQPLILRPTSCWKLEWEDLDINQQKFQSIRAFLLQQEMCMLLESQEPTATCPRTFCILLPSDGCGMLLKCVASCDILLPLSNSLCIQKQSDSIQKQVDSLLVEMPRSSSLNPLSLKAGIADKLLLAFASNDTRKQTKGVKRQVYEKTQSGSKSIPNDCGRGGGRLESSNCYSQKRAKFPHKPPSSKGSIFTRDLSDFPDDF